MGTQARTQHSLWCNEREILPFSNHWVCLCPERECHPLMSGNMQVGEFFKAFKKVTYLFLLRSDRPGSEAVAAASVTPQHVNIHHQQTPAIRKLFHLCDLRSWHRYSLKVQLTHCWLPTCPMRALSWLPDCKV